MCDLLICTRLIFVKQDLPIHSKMKTRKRVKEIRKANELEKYIQYYGTRLTLM